jgi:hypothetical protein
MKMPLEKLVHPSMPEDSCEVSAVGWDAEWQEIASRSPYATFFHSPLWHRIFVEVDSSLRPATRRFVFGDGKVAIFPLVESRRIMGISRTFQASPAGCYGGWICRDRLLPRQIDVITRWVLRNCPDLYWRLNPFDPDCADLAAIASTPDSTEALDLTAYPDDAALRANYRHSVRKQIAKAARTGIVVSTAESWDEWEAYYGLYQTRLAQWGRAASNHYPLELFRKFFEERGTSVRLWIASHEGRLIGGTLNLYNGRHCVEWHAAFDTKELCCGVRDYLVDWIIRDARDRGFTIYDFNPSGGHEGTIRFKQTFGTTSRPCDVIIRNSGLCRVGVLRKTYQWVHRVVPKPGVSRRSS